MSFGAEGFTLLPSVESADPVNPPLLSADEAYGRQLGLDAKGAPVATQTKAPAFTPLDVRGCVLFVKADDLAGADDSPVSVWPDRSGLGHDLLQADAAKRPVVKTNIVNGKRVVRFDGVDDWLRTSFVGNSQFSLVQPLTMFFAVRFRAAYSSSARAILDGTGSATAQVYREGSTAIRLQAGGFGPQVETNPENWHVYTAKFNGAGSTLRVDGGSETAPGDPGPKDPDGLTLGAGGTGGSCTPIDAHAVAVVSGPVSSADRNAIETYLRTECAI